MISSSRIRHFERIFRISTIAPTATKWKLIPTHKDIARDGNVDCRLKLGSPRYFGTDVKESITNLPLTADVGLFLTHPKVVKNYLQEYSMTEGNAGIMRERAIGYMVEAIYKLATQHLSNPILRLKDGLTAAMLDDEDGCLKFWYAIFERMETPLAIELKEKLENAGIPYQEFCRNIVEAYFTLNSSLHFDRPGYKIEPEDVINAIERHELGKNVYECLKILFSLRKEYGWKI